MKNKITKKKIHTPLVLLILDGWGVAPKSAGNAISLAKTPTMDYFYRHYPNTTLRASGKAVGLPSHQAGNSEAGHMNIGAGRLVKQDSVHILEQIKTGRFYKNAALKESVHHYQKNKGSRYHIIGLLTGDQSSHAHPQHLYALLEFCKREKIKNVYLHLFADGRDSGTHDGVNFVEKLMRNFKNDEIISTIIGRFYAMDRAHNWDRTETAYNLLTLGKGEVHAHDPISAFSSSYGKGYTDEFLPPTVVDNPKFKPEFIQNKDTVIFFNCRSERARQLAKPFVQKDFEKKGGFKRKKQLKDIHFVTFTDFGEELDHIHTAFPSEILNFTLPCSLADAGVPQAYLAEREKFAHMTYFLNGGVAKTRCGERRFRFASSKKKHFDQIPEMSTKKITDKIISLLKSGKYEFIAANFANADMLGHTGNLDATIKGVELIDAQIKRIYNEIQKQNGAIVITADHGNAENMLSKDLGEVETHHNFNPVPFFIISKDHKNNFLKMSSRGKLSNVSPTILDLMNIKKPKEMTSKSLIAKPKKKNV